MKGRKEYLGDRGGSVRGPARVLVVDENPVVAGVIAELVAELGYVAWQCHSAETARQWCVDSLVDVALTEVGLRCADGRFLTAALAFECPEIPVAALTGSPDHPAIRAGSQGAPRLVLSKPVRIQELGHAIELLLLTAEVA